MCHGYINIPNYFFVLCPLHFVTKSKLVTYSLVLALEWNIKNPQNCNAL